MKKFTFRLETLLRHREILEDLRNQEFSLAQGRYDRALLELESMEKHYQATVADRPERFDAPSIQSRERYIEAIQLQISAHRERVEVARLIAIEMRTAMIAATTSHACETGWWSTELSTARVMLPISATDFPCLLPCWLA